MPGLLKLLTAAVLGLALAAAPVAAQDIHIDPMPPHVKPQWTPVPNVPGVFYAPNMPTDVFRHGSKYYFYWEGYLYRGSKPQGTLEIGEAAARLVLGHRPRPLQDGEKGGCSATGPAGRAHRRHHPHPVGPGLTGSGPAAATTAGARKRRGASRARPGPKVM